MKRKIIILTCVFIIIGICQSSLVFSQGQAQSKKQIFLSADSLFKSGNEFYQKGKYDSSVYVWLQSLEKFESLSENKAAIAVMNNLAMAYKKLNLIEKYRSILEKQLSLCQLIGDKKQQATISLFLSIYWAEQLNYQRSDSLIESAINLTHLLGNKKDLAYMLMQAAGLKQRQLKLLPSLEYFQLAEALYQELEDSVGLGNAKLGAGLALLQLGDYPLTQKYLEQSVQIKERQKDQRGLAKGLTNLGVLYDHLGNSELAESYYNNAKVLYESLKLQDGVIDNWINIGALYHKLGYYKKALSAYLQASQIMESTKTQYAKGQLLTNLGLIYRDMNDLDSALIYLKEAVAIERQNKDWLGLAADLSIIGNIYWRRSDYHKAQQSVEEAITIRRMIGDKRGLSNDMIYLGIILSSLAESKRDESRRSGIALKTDAILSLFQNAYAIKQEIGDYAGTITALTYLGQTYRLAQQYDQALHHLKLADSLANARQQLLVQWQIKYALAKTYEKKRDYASAINEYQKALFLIENQRAEIHSEQFRMGFIKDKHYVYSEAIALLYHLQRYTEAFEVAERSKSRTFLDMLGTKLMKGQNQNRLITQLDSIDTRINELTHHANDENSRSVLNRLVEKKNAILRQIENENQELSSLVAVKPYSTDSLQALLPHDVTLLEYYVTTKAVYIFVVNRLTVFCVKSDVEYTNFVNGIFNFRRELQNPRSQKYKPLAKSLYQILIKPVIGYIKTERLVIIPHDRLHYIPFASLMNEKEEFLIDRFTLSTLTSANLLPFIKQKRKAFSSNVELQNLSLLVFGNPNVPHMSRLEKAEKEAHAISGLFTNKKVFLGDQATKTAFLENAKDYQIIHFACHGVFNMDEPLKSSLMLTSDSNHLGMLTVQELFHYPIPKAHLVVLSACETGLAKLVKGDELIGFNRAFLYAGAPSIISSLWQVSDESTALIMIALYQHLIIHDKPASLRKALLALKSQKKYAHPFFWSAFQIHGDWM